MHDYEGQRSAIANQLARLHGLSVDDALLAAHCMIVAGGLHDVAENCNEPSMRDEAKKWMARYCEIILTKSNPARAAIEEEGGRAAQVSDRHPRVI